MEISKGVRVLYQVSCAQQAEFLERAVAALPAFVELTDIVQDACLIVFPGPHRNVVLRPYHCRIGSCTLDGDARRVLGGINTDIVEYRKIEYNFLDVPMYQNG